MKKRNREINVFSISALDLFASALGAFIILTLIFMVFFSMISRQPNSETNVSNQSSNSTLAWMVVCEADEYQIDEDNLENRLAQLGLDSAFVPDASADIQAEIRSCREIERPSFLLILMNWSSSYDVDLHVVDPTGREYHIGASRHAGSDAILEEVELLGFGNEIWLHPEAEQGRYRVCFKLRSQLDLGSVEVRGSILSQNGSMEIPNQTLSQEDDVRLATHVVVDDNGDVFLDSTETGQNLGPGFCS
ncbi:MAG: hypothetical protein OXC17_06885 [Aestuariivita sp.]|nr:hypothetical protein [Aestuariivita sp.]